MMTIYYRSTCYLSFLVWIFNSEHTFYRKNTNYKSIWPHRKGLSHYGRVGHALNGRRSADEIVIVNAASTPSTLSILWREF
jgi:hypothetical protein